MLVGISPCTRRQIQRFRENL